MPEEKSLTRLLDVFGYPPDSVDPRTTIMMKKSMPVVQFFPSIPNFKKGLSLFTLADAWPQYSKLLEDNKFITPNGSDKGIQLAFLADNFPTDTFTNEYGENFLQKFTDVASEGAASLSQMMGATSLSEAYGKVTKALKEGGTAGKTIGTGMEVLGDMAGATKSALSKVGSIGNAAGSGIDLLNRLGAGSRIDFPMVWKSSTYQPSYSFTVRLYNPFPQNKIATNKYIIGPIVAIMLLATPRAENASTFTWPFLHHIKCAGLFDLNPGYISNITIVKGGDQQQISFQHRLGVVDVRIDVGSLYSSMLAGSSSVESTRPTVLKYAQAMAEEREVTSRLKDNESYTEKDGPGPGTLRTGITTEGREYTLDKKSYTPPYPSFIRIAGYEIPVPPSPKIQALVKNQQLATRVTEKVRDRYDQLKRRV